MEQSNINKICETERRYLQNAFNLWTDYKNIVFRYRLYAFRISNRKDTGKDLNTFLAETFWQPIDSSNINYGIGWWREADDKRVW